MIVKCFAVENLGALRTYAAFLTEGLNILDTRHTPELSATMDYLLCAGKTERLPRKWLRPDTRIAAGILLDGEEYKVKVTAHNGSLRLTAVDAAGADVTAPFIHAMTHCPEQDDMERFDGRDSSFATRLFQYRVQEDIAPMLSCRTGGLTDTKTFRSCLNRYIKEFSSEQVSCRKAYRLELDAEGRFYVYHPMTDGTSLSTTEEMLFRYQCYLNVAAFWADVEGLRDMHHEKKPLQIQNFLEFLDESTDISGLVERTLKLRRQAVVFAPPLPEEVKENWLGSQKE